MKKILQRITQIECIGKNLVKNFPIIGPEIKIVQNLSNEESFIASEYDSVLAIQGSFDPPLFSHLELIKKSIDLHKGHGVNKRAALLVLLSPVHIEKFINLTNHTLLGVRVLLIELFLSELIESIDIFIGVSNIPLYIDLASALHNLFSPDTKITFIMGLDVFSKLFEQKYYSKPLKETLPNLFQLNFYVAGRNEISTVDSFIDHLQKLPKIALQAFHGNKSIQFIKLSKKYQYSNSTEIRAQLATNTEETIPFINPDILKFLKRYQIYVFNSEFTVKQIIIQQIVHYAVLDELKEEEIIELISDIFVEIGSKSEQSIKILSEYKTKENTWLKEKYNWLTLHSS